MNSEACNKFYTGDDVDDLNVFTDAAHEVSKSLQVITQGTGDELICFLHNPLPFPNLIFLDLNMPVKNGYEVLQEIKQSEHTQNLPGIIFSTLHDENAINATRELSANLYIPKPSTFSSLKKVINYSLSINWDAFTPSTEDFIYRAN